MTDAQGYLEKFPDDASSSLCGQGACNDETGSAPHLPLSIADV